jgi:hypothetical protein
MLVIGKSKPGELILKATEEELLKIQGHPGPAVEGMFKVGKQIKVSEQFEKLLYFQKNAVQLTNVVQTMRESADNIEAAIPE